jgi:hypothetical protein
VAVPHHVGDKPTVMVGRRFKRLARGPRYIDAVDPPVARQDHLKELAEGEGASHILQPNWQVTKAPATADRGLNQGTVAPEKFADREVCS